MFHTPEIKVIENISKKLKIPAIIEETEGIKEEELKELESAIKKAIKNYKIEGIVTGAVASTYQASRIQNICNKLNIECFNPLWQMDQEELLREIVKLNFKVKIVKVAADGFDEKWIGRIIDEKAIEDLLRLREKYGIAINGEGGEYESEIVNFPDDINN